MNKCTKDSYTLDEYAAHVIQLEIELEESRLLVANYPFLLNEENLTKSLEKELDKRHDVMAKIQEDLIKQIENWSEDAEDLGDKVENQKEKILILQAQVYILKDAMRVMVTGGD
tara:strand:+ start:115 stop:456 length:342 start_codon:yes stop_codon:yes gene_type:complete